MMESRNFPYPDKPFATLFSERGIDDLPSAMDYIRYLPYGRNRRRDDFTLVLKEGVGTCSSKHACLFSLITEQEISGWSLILGMYRMNRENTPQIGNILLDHGLSYIPEAHTYLRYGGATFDLTFHNSSFDVVKNDILDEENILPDQVIDYKVQKHKDFIFNWIKNEKISHTFDSIWRIREMCIQRLSMKT